LENEALPGSMNHLRRFGGGFPSPAGASHRRRLTTSMVATPVGVARTRRTLRLSALRSPQLFARAANLEMVFLRMIFSENR
jgi:hypothetical protein